MSKYNHKIIEKKWKKAWEKSGIYKTKETSDKPKYFVLDMFPYPSGAGLHVGHPKGYIATDIVARMKMMQGFNVLHPMGWDAFGLPAENYAIANKVHPSEATAKNIKTFKKQLGLLGFTYDWDREVNTTDPKYYKWTQWAFLQMYKKGLAFESNEPINWCPTCQTGLANEDLEDGKCERCGTVVEQKPMRQWVLKITKYADRLLNDLDKLKEWPEPIKEMQRNWIGRSEGAEINFNIKTNVTRFVILHGRNGSPDSHNFPWLKKELENRGYEVEVPALPNTKEPSDEEQTEFVLKNCKFDENTVIVGHSFGGVVALRLLERGIKVDRVVLLCTPFSGEFLDKKVRASVTEACQKGFDFKKIKNGAKDFSLLYDISDYVVPMSDGEDFAKNLGVELKKVKGVEPHLCGVEEPEVLTVCTLFLKVFTTRPDTIFGATYIVMAPEHPLVKKLKSEIRNFEEVEKYIESAKNKSNLERTELQKEKTGVELKGIKAINPATNEELPIFVADYVITGYGTGAIMSVPAHDERDFEFAKKYNLPIKEVLKGGQVEESAFIGDGLHINSDFLDGLNKSEAISKIISWLEEKGIGTKKVQYKLRDWVFSRQRYWGEPIPLIHCEKCGVVPVPVNELPVVLPKVKDYAPSGTGESPLATIHDWVNVKCPECGGKAKRETNTMPQWAGSCWYYLRYIDPNNNKELVSKEKEKYWSPVDLYVGGAEHVTRHLIYARFWHKFLFDIGVVSTEEPFTRLQNLGVILAEDGRKMSKRWNNVINPDEIVEEYGADSMRVYEMFMGPFDQPCAWSTQGLVGTHRFMEKVWALQEKLVSISAVIPAQAGISGDKRDSQFRGNDKLTALLHQTIKKISDDIPAMKYNTAIAQMMILVNELGKEEKISNIQYSIFLQLLAPFAPHIAEELWSQLGHTESIFLSTWPKYDAELAKDTEITLAVQVNGKLRDTLKVSADISEEEAKKQATNSVGVQKWLEGKTPKKVIYVKGKLVSIVV